MKEDGILKGRRETIRPTPRPTGWTRAAANLLLVLSILACPKSDQEDTGTDTQETGTPGPVFVGWGDTTVSLEDADYTFLGEVVEEKAGFDVTGVGDVDGDGLDDLLVTADTSGANGMDSGQAYLLLAAGLGAPGISSLGSADYVFAGESEMDLLGHSSAQMGDLDGDGRGDFLITAYVDAVEGQDVGSAYLVLGADLGEAGSFALDAASYKLVGEADFDRMGHGAACAGDVDGDGLPDLLLGAYGNNEGGGADAGKAYLLLGSGLAPGSGSVVDADYAFLGENPGDKAGVDVSAAGDVDGDGRSDLLISAKWNSDGGLRAGKAYLWLAGSLVSGSRSLAEADYQFVGVEADDICCIGSYAGDVDGDGRGDFLLGAQVDELKDDGPGRAHLFLGATLEAGGSRPLTSADLVLYGEENGDAAGISVASAGDMDRDGRDDLFVGAFRHDSMGEDQGGGAAYLLLAATLWSGEIRGLVDADYTFLGDTAFGAAGRAVGSAGDVNGDGLLDLLVGAPMEADQAALGAGRAHLLVSP